MLTHILKTQHNTLVHHCYMCMKDTPANLLVAEAAELV